MNKKFLYLLGFLIFAACKSVNRCDSQVTTGGTIYRFLYEQRYGIPLSEKDFWHFGKNESEFIIQTNNNLNKKDVLDFVCRLSKVKPFDARDNPFIYQYALVFADGDTIYINDKLDEWIVKEDKNNYTYYKDENKKKDENEFYTFFLINHIFWKLTPPE